VGCGDDLGGRALDRVAETGPLDHRQVVAAVSDRHALLMADAEPFAEDLQRLSLVGVGRGHLEIPRHRSGRVEPAGPAFPDLR